MDLIVGVAGEDTTAWSIVKDLTNNKFLFRGHYNLAIRRIDLNKVASTNGRKYITLEDEFKNGVEDVDDRMIPVDSRVEF